MDRTHLLATLLLCCVTTTSVFAQGNSGNNSSSNAGSSGENGGGQSARSDQGNSNSSPLSTGSARVRNHAEEALRAVQSGQAVPLSRIVGVLERTDGGQVIDAKLVKAGKVLLYRIKVLQRDGTVATQFYYAPTGQRIQLQ
jgi:hypothetical protein